MTIFKKFRTGFIFSSGSTTYFVDMKKELTKHNLQLRDIEESFPLGVPLLETGYYGLHALRLLEFMLTSGVSVARKEKSSSAMRGRRESYVHPYSYLDSYTLSYLIRARLFQNEENPPHPPDSRGGRVIVSTPSPP